MTRKEIIAIIVLTAIACPLLYLTLTVQLERERVQATMAIK